MTELGTVVKTSVDAAALAIPGERYSRLIDDLNGTDTPKRDAARLFLRNLGGITFDETASYQASVWIGYTGEPIHLDVFRAPSAAPEHVRERFLSAAINLSNTVANTIVLPPSRQQVDDKLDSDFRSMASRLAGNATVQSVVTCVLDRENEICTTRYRYAQWIPGINYEATFATPQEAADQGLRPRDEATAYFKRTFWTLYEQASENRGGTATLAVPWGVLGAKQWVVVLLPNSEWDTHKGDLTVRVLVHKRNDRTASLDA